MRSRYSNIGEIALLTISWTILLLLIDKSLTTVEEEGITGQFSTPQVRMHLRHVGCSESRQAAVVQALSSLPWLSVPEFKGGVRASRSDDEKQPRNGTAQAKASCDDHLTILARVQDVQQADFMPLIKILRDIGVAPETIEFGGLPRFALMAEVADLSCRSCRRAVRDALTPLQVSVTYYATTNQGQIDPNQVTSFRWLESQSLDESTHTISAQVRPHQAAQVNEMIKALEGAGMPPFSVRILVTKADKAEAT